MLAQALRRRRPFLAVSAAAAAALLLAAARAARPGQAPGERTAAAPRAGVSAFEAAKAGALLRDRLPCLGCHQVRGEGGRIGPDLTRVGARYDAGYVAAMIRAPQRLRPGTIMPATPVTAATADLVARYLVSLAGDAAVTAAGRLPAPPGAGSVTPAPARGAPDARALYATYCASCHGASGRGDGPNARDLPVPPAAHASADAMGRRADDVLYDAIAAGGHMMGRSARMPAFGGTLRPDEIRALVRHIRALCGCEGPAWSRDGERAVSAR